MPLLFSDLPQDIKLELMDSLELPECLFLLMTCKSFHGLSHERSFWISALERTRAKTAMACPRYTDLSQYPLESLKDLARSWLKLRENWNRRSPQIIHPVTSTKLPEPADMILVVQGTDITLLHLTNSRTLICWDARNAKPYPVAPLNIGGRLNGVSVPRESSGMCTVAFLTIGKDSSPGAYRHVITISYENGKPTGLENISCSEVPTPAGPHMESLFLTKHVVGSIVTGQLQEESTIRVGRIDGSESDCVSLIKLHRPVSHERDLTVCFTYDGHLYNLVEDGVSVHIQHVSRQALSGRCDQFTLHKADVGLAPDSWVAFCFILPTTPFYGVSAVFVRLANEHTQDATLAFTFVLNTLTHAPDDGMTSPLAFDLPCPTEYVDGQLASDNYALVWIDHSGCNIAVIISDRYEARAELMLVRYHPETGSTSSHILDVPDDLDLDDMNGVCVDDTTGAVYLVDKEGVFSTLRYV
ncbi:hypothetical protein C8R43DRAFT_186573 [Mycena crocata]|nr:hypothetical protein C8R43DRAFT_186573 [Mycena crocata]